MSKIIIVELNEFNDELLNIASKELKLENIQKVLSFKKTSLITDDRYESDYLEPWVQLVSVHTGIPSNQHKIKHLGDIPNLNNPQIWELLSSSNITSGVWGLMNASRNQAKNCLFFVPDPWTFSEQAYPNELNAFLNLPRYISKNYLNLSKIQLLKKSFSLLKFIFKSGAGKPFLAELPCLIKNILKFKGEHFTFICFIDYISTKLFLFYQKKYNPDLSIIFLNSIAHLQHHHWNDFNYKDNERLIYGLKYIDKILGDIFSTLDKDQSFAMVTPLSQENTNAEDPWILYKLKDQNNFLEKIGVKYKSVESHMTYDAHIFFNNEEDKNKAFEIIQNSKIREKIYFWLNNILMIN